MAMKERHPAWFKMFWHQRALIDSLPDAKVGQALKAAYQYFEDGTVPKMTPLAFTLFSSIKPYVDESFADFEAISKKNSENIKRRWAKRGDTTDTSGIQSLPHDTKNTEAEADTPNGVDASVEARRQEKRGRLRGRPRRTLCRYLTKPNKCAILWLKNKNTEGDRSGQREHRRWQLLASFRLDKSGMTFQEDAALPA